MFCIICFVILMNCLYVIMAGVNIILLIVILFEKQINSLFYSVSLHFNYTKNQIAMLFVLLIYLLLEFYCKGCSILSSWFGFTGSFLILFKLMKNNNRLQKYHFMRTDVIPNVNNNFAIKKYTDHVGKH